MEIKQMLATLPASIQYISDLDVYEYFNRTVHPIEFETFQGNIGPREEEIPCG